MSGPTRFRGPRDQPTAAPTNKVLAGTAAGAATLLVVTFAEQFGLDVPPEVAAALTVVLTFAASYLRKEATP